MSDFNDRVIAQFRSTGGHVDGFGSGLVLLHTTGAKSGERRVNPVAGILEGGSWLVIASAAGSPRNPGWYFNLKAHPDVSVETPSGSLDVHAIEIEDDADYDAAFARFVDRSQQFQEYTRTTEGRRMPIFRLEPRG